MNKILVILLPLALVVAVLTMAPLKADIDLDSIKLPPGFQIEVYAEEVDNARQMVLGEQGTLFVGSRKAGKVHALVDQDGDQRADRQYLIADDLSMPSGLEFRDGSLYVGALNRILRYDAIETRLDNPPEPVVLNDQLPDKRHHGWKYLRFGPDGLLYIPVGAPCNICEEPGFAEIRTMNPDGTDLQVYAEGIRNSVGLAFHPVSGELWFTDNGRDRLGDEVPQCELNHAPQAGLHFGYPYCHQGNLPDPEFGQGRNCADYVSPAVLLGPHVAPLGLAFYTGNMFPADYHHQLFIAEHGSWNRSEKIGYRVKLVHFDEQGAVSGQEVFAQGWLQGENAWGRPNDVLVMPDGALLVSDDAADVVYRISYSASD